MNQDEINTALAIYVDGGDPGPWQRVIEAIRAGEVTVRAGQSVLTIKALPRYGALGAALRHLRVRSGLTQQELADRCEVSVSLVVRVFAGEVLSTWPTVALLIQTMGGDPGEFLDLYRRSREDSRRGRVSD